MDRGWYVVGREGIEPPQSKTADLQSAELTTCSTYPCAATATDRDCGLVVGPATDGSAMEPTTGLEPGTCGLQNRCSTIELRRHDRQSHTADDPNRRREMIGPLDVMGQAWGVAKGAGRPDPPRGGSGPARRASSTQERGRTPDLLLSATSGRSGRAAGSSCAAFPGDHVAIRSSAGNEAASHVARRRVAVRRGAGRHRSVSPVVPPSESWIGRRWSARRWSARRWSPPVVGVASATTSGPDAGLAPPDPAGQPPRTGGSSRRRRR